MKVQIAGQTEELPDRLACSEALRRVLSGKKFRQAVAAKVCDATRCQLVDLSTQVPGGCRSIEPVYADSDEGQEILRHSTAHVLAAAATRLFPGIKVAIGPAIENGFYYDFDFERPLSAEDLGAIEAEMAKIAASAIEFEHEMLPREQAAELFRSDGQDYKLEILEGIPDGEVGIYKCGEFADLCRGPHVPNTGFCQNFKLLSVAGAYWRGDEHKPMLSRVYGTAFADKKALDAHLKRLEEAAKRDHRKLGKELDYFHFEEKVAPGMVFWLPKGMLVRTILEDFWRKEHLKREYEIVQGPQLLRAEAWQQSGHYEHYKDNMYFTEIEEDGYGIKPMNCIGHMLIYQHHMRSYRDLPQRYFELGVVHRHEKSGVLHGLMRVRQFTQDDAHIICTPEQLEGEILQVIHLIRDLMNLFDFEFKVAISTRPEDSIGTDEAWEMATTALTQAVDKAGLPYGINEGDGAFYGPKIDVKLLDCLGREWQCSTIQVDFTMPERFELEYVGQDGKRHRPVMVHRAIMGSVERFIGILLEQYAGALPVWLAPEQTRLLPVSEEWLEQAGKVRKELEKQGIRAGIDDRSEKLGFKIREAQVAKVPYMLVVGEKEAQAGGAAVRLRNGENLGIKTVSEIVELIRSEAEKPFLKGGMSYRFA